ncbi:MAG: winged helix DNA-binding domain-containing protein [Sciscionella sp.]
MSDAVLTSAMLHRQWLDRRCRCTVVAAVRHLVGLQAQAADAPYWGLWTRIEGFVQRDLTASLESRAVVRAGVLRGTQHLVAADDYPWLRGLVQPIGVRNQRASFGRRTRDVDLDAVAAAARGLLQDRTLTRPQLRDLLAVRFPGGDADALAWSVPSLVPVVHPPPNGTWRSGGATPFALAEQWLGRAAIDLTPDPRALIERYLAAFGPASVADVQVWSGLRGLAEVVDRMPLARFRDARGRELVDLPDAPRSDLGAESAVRFLPEFDNLVVAYADRNRLMSDEVRQRVCVGSMIFPTLLIDGRVAGTWRLVRSPQVITLEVTPVASLSAGLLSEIHAEGARLLAFAAEPEKQPQIKVQSGAERS